MSQQSPSRSVADEVLDLAGRVIQEQGLASTPTLDAELGEEGIGLDSIGRMELLRAVEQRLQITIPEKYWGSSKQMRTLGEVVNVVSRLK